MKIQNNFEKKFLKKTYTILFQDLHLSYHNQDSVILALRKS